MAGSIAVGGSDVLIVVDVQNDFCPGGGLAVPRGDEIVAAINRLAAKFDHVVLTQDWHPPRHLSFASSHPGRRPFETIALPYGAQVLWPDHCVQGTAGAAFHPALDIPHAALVIRKGFRPAIDSYSAFLRERPHHPDRPRRLPPRAPLCARVRRRPRLRFLRALFRRGRPRPRARRHRDRRRLPRHRPRRLGGGDPGELRGAGGGVRGGGGGGGGVRGGKERVKCETGSGRLISPIVRTT